MALTPEELKAIPNSFIKLYQELEDFIIGDIARRISKVGNLTESAELETIRAREIGISLKLIKDKIKEILGLTEDKIDELFKEVAMYSVEKENELYNTSGLSLIKISENKALQEIIQGAAKQTYDELYKLTQSMGFAQKINGKTAYKPIAKYYHDAMDLAVMQIKSGATTYNTAIKQAVENLSDSGIRHVGYESGFVNRIDAAVRRAVMTGANQMTQKITLEGMKESGCDFVETTAHIGARPDHRLWQGRVFCYSGKSDKYPPFIEVTGYGTGPGLGGWNCRHSFHPFIPGVSVRVYSDERLKNIDPPPFEYNGKTYTYYEASQHQRYIERAIRRTRRELVGYNASGLKTDFTNSSIKLKQQEKYYREFSKTAKIPMEKDRLQTLGFNKSVSQKAVWSKKNYDINKFNEFRDILGDGGPKTLEEFKDIRYNKPKEWLLLNQYKESRARNMISAFTSFNDYKHYKDRIEKELVGLKTSNGIKITGQSNHFIERVFGTSRDPKTKRPREGVLIEDIKDALLNGTIRIRKNDPNSIKFITDKCMVSINPKTGVLIQTNP